ncbi:MAG: tyrosine-protein phosphatase [Rubricella sp.]
MDEKPKYADWRDMQQRQLEERWANILETPAGRRKAWLDMTFSDHGFLRALYLNRHRLGRTGWRAAQPNPRQIEAIARDGVRTIVSLRGGKLFGSLPLEIEACEKHGITFHVQRLFSRQLPPRSELLELFELMRSVEKPVLYHCKSGADRAGLAAALHMIIIEGRPVEEAKEQLSLRFLHLRQAKTGVLDELFDAYLVRKAETGIGFEDWVRTEYDPVAITEAFNARRGRWLSWFVDKVLRRE